MLEYAEFTHWQRVGVVPSPTTVPEAVPPLVAQFSAWMRQHRGVRESRLGNYVPLVQEFLAALETRPQHMTPPACGPSF